MAHALRITASFVLALFVATYADSSTMDALSAAALLAVLQALPAQLPEPPVGALLFGAVGACVLLRRRPQRLTDFND